ncbi:chain-length determining protein [Iodidimonas gelatinilytica]|uniref:Chain-length determining protein n=2 Tax=Iodidimonas gelatinilytica TaxID=1236966 RepID=A0A5A7MWM6_9PROT|nr:chain-length determining protein [Iodidimonas gelatinilytica]
MNDEMTDLYQQILFYGGALWRRRWLIFSISTMVAALGWMGVASLPNQYRSSARIYVDTGTVLRPLLAGVAVEDDVNRQVEIMRRTLLSRPNMEQLARMTDMDIEADTPSQMEALVERLQSRIALRSERDNLFNISFVDPSPNRARDVVQALTTLFVENNLGQNRADMDNAQDFLQRQISDYERKLDTAERDLARFQQDNAAFLPGQTGLQTSLAEAKAARASIKGALEDTLARQKLLERELAETPQLISHSAGGSGPPSNIEARIIDVQASLEAMRARYTDQHPDVVTLNRQLANLRKEYEAMSSAFGGAGGPSQASPGEPAVPNPVYSDLRLELIRERSNAETLKEQLHRADDRVAALEERVFQVPEVEAQLKRLTRDYDVIRKNYETLLSRRESARISADREQAGSRVNFRIIEAASIPLLPDGPPRGLFLAVVLVGSVIAGAGVAWVLAMARVTYGSIDHLRRDFDIPVIGALTVVGGLNDERNKRMDKIRLLGGIAALLLVFIILVFIESRFGLPRSKGVAYMLCFLVFAGGGLVLLLERFRFPILFGDRPITLFDRAIKRA